MLCWQDPEEIGFANWRNAFYIAGDLNNFLLLLDGLFVFKEKSIAQSQPFEVHLHPHLDAGEAGQIWDDLECKEYSYNEPSKDLPLNIFEVKTTTNKMHA